MSRILKNPAGIMTASATLLLWIAIIALSPWQNAVPEQFASALANPQAQALLSANPQIQTALATFGIRLIIAPPDWTTLWVILGALLGILAVLMAYLRPALAPSMQWVALMGGVLGAGYIAYFIRVQPTFNISIIVGGVTGGFWVMMLGTIGLILQIVLPTQLGKPTQQRFIRLDTAQISRRAGNKLLSLYIGQNIRVALHALMSNKLRAGLTMLGIIIGVGSVVALLAVGEGTQQSVTASIESIGTNLLTISPMGIPNQLTEADALAIEAEIGGISAIAPQLSSNLTVSTTDTSLSTQVIGVMPSQYTVRNLEIEAGRFINQTDVDGKMRVVVLGLAIAEDLFGDANPIGQMVKIMGQNFEVIGLLAQQNSFGGQDPNMQMLIPMPTAYRYVNNAYAIASNDRQVTSIAISVINRDQMTAITNQITALLRARHGLSPSDEANFRITNQQQLLDTVSTVTNTFTIMLAAIAGVSLVVGGIGVMNITLVSVTERTREIGLRKALGAKYHHILQQFLIETVMLCIIGGVLGVIIGVSIALLINSTGLLTVSITTGPIALGLGVSIITGIFFGVYPASRAASLQPIEAIRYE